MTSSGTNNDQSRRLANSSKGDVTITLRLADLLMVADALMIGANSAMMSSQPGAQKRLKEILDVICEHSPVPKRSRKEGYGWFNAVSKIRSAATYEAYSMRCNWPRDHAQVIVEVDGKRHVVTSELPTDEVGAVVQRVSDALEQAAPVEANRLSRMKVTFDYPHDVPYGDEEFVEDAKGVLKSALGELDLWVVRGGKRTYKSKREVEIELSAPSHIHDVIEDRVNNAFEVSVSAGPRV